FGSGCAGYSLTYTILPGTLAVSSAELSAAARALASKFYVTANSPRVTPVVASPPPVTRVLPALHPKEAILTAGATLSKTDHALFRPAEIERWQKMSTEGVAMRDSLATVYRRNPARVEATFQAVRDRVLRRLSGSTNP